jgi:hypothetical protein
MSTEQSKPKAKATLDWLKPPFTKPKTWTEIEKGSLVVVYESADDKTALPARCSFATSRTGHADPQQLADRAAEAMMLA